MRRTEHSVPKDRVGRRLREKGSDPLNGGGQTPFPSPFSSRFPSSFPAPFSAGFTLTEVMAAIAILSIVVFGLLLSRSRAMDAMRTTLELNAATELCAAQAERVRAGLAMPGTGAFESSPGYTWEITATPPPEGLAGDLAAYTVRVRPPSRAPENEAVLTVWRARRPVPEGKP